MTSGGGNSGGDAPHAPEPPAAHDEDDQDVAWALSTAGALWRQGNLVDAAQWVRRAATASASKEDGTPMHRSRAEALAQAASEMATRLGASAAEGAPALPRPAIAPVAIPRPAIPPRPPVVPSASSDDASHAKTADASHGGVEEGLNPLDGRHYQDGTGSGRSESPSLVIGWSEAPSSRDPSSALLAAPPPPLSPYAAEASLDPEALDWDLPGDSLPRVTSPPPDGAVYPPDEAVHSLRSVAPPTRRAPPGQYPSAPDEDDDPPPTPRADPAAYPPADSLGLSQKPTRPAPVPANGEGEIE